MAGFGFDLIRGMPHIRRQRITFFGFLC